MKASIPAGIGRVLSVVLLGVCALGSAMAAPRLKLSETTVGPVSVAVGANGPTRTIDATNAGDGTLNLSVTSSASWVAPTVGAPGTCGIFSGTLCYSISFALNTASLAKGTHTAVVTVSDPNAVDAPQTITVTVQMGGSLPDSADLYVSTTAGSTDSARFFTNSTIAGVPTVTSGSGWLSLAFDGASSFSFTLPYAIRATNPGTLAAGTYNGSLAISGSTFTPDNRSVPVTLHVTASPILQISDTTIRQTLAQAAPKITNYVTATNRGLGTLTLSAPTVALSSGAGWLTASLVPGTNFIQLVTDTATLSPGEYTATVTVNSNAANSGQTILYALTVVAKGRPLISAGGVVNNATFAGNDTLARGTIAAVFGQQLLDADPISASTLPLGTTMGGVRVLVNGEAAPIYYTSYGQINFQVPYTAATGLATVTVERGGQISNTVAVNIAERAPRLLRLGIGEYAIAVNTDGSFPVPASAGLGASGHPAKRGDTLVLYALGLGQTAPTVVSGAAAPSSPLAVLSPFPSVTLGPISVSASDSFQPLFAGLTPGFVGLYQINFTIPQNSETGDRVPLFLSFGTTVLSNTVEIAITN